MNSDSDPDLDRLMRRLASQLLGWVRDCCAEACGLTFGEVISF